MTTPYLQHEFEVCVIYADGYPMFYFACSCGLRDVPTRDNPAEAVRDAEWHMRHPDEPPRHNLRRTGAMLDGAA